MPTSKLVLLYASLFFVLLGSLFSPTHGQDLEAEAKKLRELGGMPSKIWQEGIKISGGLSSNTTFYQNNILDENGRLPFESILSGNMTFDFFGKVKMPFTFTLNSQNVSFKSPFDERLRFQQPFNRYQFKPTYKSLTVLVGVSSMTFSPYTLNGHRFEGIGVLFKPKKKPYYASFMKGVFQKNVLIDTSGQTRNNRPAYTRNAWGGQVGYKSKLYTGEISFLRSLDALNSLPYTIDAFALPQANVVLGLKGKATLFKKWNVLVDIAYSGLTKDIRNANNEPLSNNFDFGGLLLVNRSTVLRKALKTGIQYDGKGFKVGLDYSRVDPDYTTHGAYFFVNDLENIATNVSGQALERKLSYNLSLGRQHNNLDNNSANLQTLWQWVGSAGLSYAPSEKLMASINYSTFQSYTNLRSDLEYLTSIGPYAGLDTLNYRQINQNLQIMLLGQLPNSTKEHTKMLSINGLYQGSSNQQGGLQQNIDIASLNAQYSNTLTANQRSYAFGITLTRNDLVVSQEWLMGPSFNYTYSFLNKLLKAQGILTYLKNLKGNNQSSDLFNTRISLGYTPNKQHNLSLGVLGMYRNILSAQTAGSTYWDMTVTFGYQYSFQGKLWKPQSTPNGAGASP